MALWFKFHGANIFLFIFFKITQIFVGFYKLWLKAKIMEHPVSNELNSNGMQDKNINDCLTANA